MTYKILSLEDAKEWSNLLGRLPTVQQDVYYTPEYYSLYEKLGDGNAFCFVYEEAGELAIYPFLKNKINNLRFNLDRDYYDIQGAYGYNGVASNRYDIEFINAFYKVFSKYALESNIIAEFTRFHPLLQNKTFSENHMSVCFDRHTIYLDLNKPIEEIYKSFQRTTRKQIKRGTSNHKIDVKIDYSDFDTETFYSVYDETMTRVNSIDYLYFNKNYFEELAHKIPTIMFSAFIKDEMIASIICMVGKQFLHGHLGGAKTDYLSYSPYSILYYEIIKEAKKNQFQKVHFGGGSSALPNDTLLQFKLNFSNTKAEFFIGKKIYNQQIYDKVIEQWSIKFPERTEQYKNMLLKYRY